jgi:cytochrome c553
MPEAAPATGESSASTAPEAKPAAAAGVDTPPKAAPATAGSSASTIPEAQTAAAAGAEASSDPFRETIQPILSARCGACHDPGGKMYARLPFDNPQVVSSHSEGVLKRLKGDDRAALERWLAGLAPAGGQR